MKRHADVAPLRNARIADDESIRSRLLRREHLPMDLVHLVIAKQYIESYENPATELVGVVAQPGNLLHGIARVLARPEVRTRNIHGIGTAVDSCDADVCVSCGSKKFECSH